jgi:hypothetical protein
VFHLQLGGLRLLLLVQLKFQHLQKPQVVAQPFKYLHQVQETTHPLLALNPLGLRLLAVAVAVVVLT